MHRALDLHVFRHVLFDKTECGIALQFPDIIRIAGHQVIHADDLMAMANEIIAKMGT